jgi:hypothetical protein
VEKRWPDFALPKWGSKLKRALVKDLKDKDKELAEKIEQRQKKPRCKEKERILQRCREKKSTQEGLFSHLKTKEGQRPTFRIVQNKGNGETQDEHISETVLGKNSKSSQPGMDDNLSIIKGPKAVIEEHRKLWQVVFTVKLDEAERTKSEKKESKYPVNHKVTQVTLLDFMKEIRGGKSKTSPGPDMITNDIWKALPTKIQTTLGKILLICWKEKIISDQ